MSLDSIVAPLASRSYERSVWIHAHFDPTTRFVTLHSSVRSISLKIVTQFLTTEWRSNYINNDSTAYRAVSNVGFYMFQTKTSDSDKQRCDVYGEWINNGTQIVTCNELRIRRTYWYYEKNKMFRRVEYHLQQEIDSVYRGLIVYFRPHDVNQEPETTIPWHQPNDVRRQLYDKVAATRNPKATTDKLIDNPRAPVPRNVKQVDNMQQRYRSTKYDMDRLYRLATVSNYVVQHVGSFPEKQAVFFTDHLLSLMKQQRVWYTDITFNMWTGFVTGITFKNSDFEENNIHPGYIYLHQVSDIYSFLTFLVTRQSNTHSTATATCKSIKSNGKPARILYYSF